MRARGTGLARMSRKEEHVEEEFWWKLDKKTPDRIRISNRPIHRTFRSLLTIAGTIDLVLDHDATQLARSAIKMLIDVKTAAPDKNRSAIVPFTIYTSQNI
jgi:hypothetical protein